jgi:hypothetical protein
MSIKRTEIGKNKVELEIGDGTKVTIVKDGVVILDVFQNKSIALFPEELQDLISCLQEARRLIENSLLR